MGLFESIFGTHSDHELKRINPLVDKVFSYEEEFAKEGIKIIYFPYTEGISSTKITEALKHVRGWVQEPTKITKLNIDEEDDNVK